MSLEGIAPVGGALCLTAAIGDFASGDQKLELKKALRAWAPLWAFLGWGLVAPLLAGRLPSGTGLGRHVELLAIPLAAYSLSRLSARQLLPVGKVAAWTFAASCVAGGLQYFGLWPAKEHFVGLEWTKLNFDRVYEAAPGVPDRYMAGGLSFHRLRFAHVGTLAALTTLSFGLLAAGRRKVVLLGLAVAGGLSVFLFPMARAASAALVLSMALVLLLASSEAKRARAALLGAGLLFLGGLGAAVHGPLRERLLLSASGAGNGERGALLRTGLRAIAAYPIAGAGLGQFRPSRFADESTPKEVLEHPGKAHNQFVSIAAETGLVGLLLFLAALIAMWRRLSVRDPLGIAARGAIAAFVLLGLLHDPLFHSAFGLAWGLIVGAGFSVREALAPATRSEALAGTPRATAGHSFPR